MPSVLRRGKTSAAPLPQAGQMAPEMYADVVRGSLGADGRVPHLTQRRVMPFFWPIRASTCHHSSMGVPQGSAARIVATSAGKFF